MSREDVMIDLETMGTKPGCIVLSIGAARFRPATGEVLSTFYERVAFKDSVLRGLAVDPDTYQWWKTQPKEVFAEAMGGTKALPAVTTEFDSWAYDQKGVQDFWCQGIDFDFPIWEHAFKLGSPIAHYFAPFWKRRDTRTLYAVAGLDTDLMKSQRDGDHHNALADTLFQIKCVHECYRRLGRAEEPAPQQEIEELEEL